jgi:hypothetical protein
VVGVNPGQAVFPALFQGAKAALQTGRRDVHGSSECDGRRAERANSTEHREVALSRELLRGSGKPNAEISGQAPEVGRFGSINTAEACKAKGGTLLPRIFTWMIHVFPFEDNLKDVLSMNDDIPHFGAQQ